MRTFNHKHDVNAKQLKKQHKELRKLRSNKGWNVGILPTEGTLKGFDSSYTKLYDEYEYQGCFN